MKNNIKTTQLSTNQKKQIGKFAEMNPKVKKTEIALKFRCTYNQVINAIKQYNNGDFIRKNPRQSKAKIESLLMEKSPEDIILSQFHLAVAQLEQDKKLPADARINQLDKIVGMRKTLQQITLENHIKNKDIGIIKLMVQKFAPEITDDELIALYKEAFEEWKNL